MSRSWVDIDLGAVAANTRTLLHAAGGAELCAVVKADGYGHGAVPVAETALAAGASGLAVAQVAEGVALRAAGIEAPIWVLSEPDPDELTTAVAHRLEPAVYSRRLIDAAARAVAARRADDGRDRSLTVHLKLDTGMGRVGADPAHAVDLARAVVACPELQLGSVFTHLACADIDGEAGLTDGATTGTQLDRYDDTLACLDKAGIEVELRHAANSAGTIAHPRSRYDVVRCGISLYGLPPSPGLAGAVDLAPAMTWRSKVSHVKRVDAGTPLSYGHAQMVDVDATVATIPVGYADGYRRSLWNTGGAVLIGGRRRPIVGVVTMDQTLVDCGDDPVQPGDEVVLLGVQGSATITADDLAASLGTINYEIPVAVGNRVERRHLPV